MSRSEGSRVLFQLSGSIAAYKACFAISSLVQEGVEVQAVASGTLFLASALRKPYLVAPAMNQAMYRHPATQASLERLRGWGVRILASPEGRQACGDVGPGRLLEPELIVREIRSALKSGD